MREPKLYCVLLSLLILIVSCRIFPQINYNQLHSPDFETISNEDGLPENTVTCILQDYLGYMWFGTQNGVVKYDGFSMEVFKPDAADDKSISGREISYLFVDKNKTLWIGTLNGLNKYNREDESFISYKYNCDNSNSISCDQVRTIYEDRSGRFWVGTRYGLNLFDRDNEKFTRFYFIKPELKTVSTVKDNRFSLAVTAITEDPISGELLLGTGLKGLWRFENNKKIISKYKLNGSSEINLNATWVQNFYRARDDRIWISALNSLSALDPVSGELKGYYEFPIRKEDRNAEPNSLGSSVIEDQYGNIVAGFFAGQKGLVYLNPKTGDVTNFELIPNKVQNTLLNKIHSLYEDRSGIIWIGTWSNWLHSLQIRRLLAISRIISSSSVKMNHTIVSLFITAGNC